jgi:hypothetical protein
MFSNTMASRLLLNLLYDILRKEIGNRIHWRRYFFDFIEHKPMFHYNSTEVQTKEIEFL